MTAGIESTTVVALGLALDAASMRQQAIAANIANSGTADYVPMRVSFEAQLQQAADGLPWISGPMLANARPTLEPSLDALGMPAKVLLDVEVASMAQNAVQYQALAKGLSKHYGILAAAISEGKK